MHVLKMFPNAFKNLEETVNYARQFHEEIIFADISKLSEISIFSIHQIFLLAIFVKIFRQLLPIT